MPTISQFYGIKIYIHYNDHAEPHFHAHYSEYKAKVSIRKGNLIAGKLPPNATRLIRKWMKDHKEELLENWNFAEERKKLKDIKPLE